MYSPCCPPVITNPCTTVNTVPCPGGDPCSTQLISCEQVIYSGPNLPCTQIKNCDTLCVALQKIDEQICDLNSEILILQQVLNNCCNTTSTTTTVLPSTTTTSTSSSTSTTSTSSTSSTSSTTSTSSSTTSTTSSTSSTSSSTTTSTTTLCPCVDDIIINVTVPGLFTYNDCCNVSKEIEFLTTGERAVTDSNCIRFSTFAAVAPAAFTLVSRGDCCTPSCTTTSTSSTSSSTSTTSSTSSTSSTTSTTSSTSSTSSTSTTTSTSSSTSTTSSTSSTSSTTTTSTSSSTTTSTTTGIPPSCFCYTVENTSEVTANFSYTACGGGPIDDTLGAGLSTNVCSSTFPLGDDGISVTGGTLSCTSNGDCIGTTTTTTSSSSSTTTSTTTCISPCYNTEYSITGSGTAEWFDCNASSPTTLFVSGGIQSFCNDGSGVVFYGGATGTPTGNQSICGCNEPIPTTTTTSTSSSTTTTSTTLSPG